MQINPFATKYTQPGAIPYQYFDHHSSADLVQSLLQLKSQRALIVGPHGSGKSTLIASLVLELKSIKPEIAIHETRFSTNIPSRTTLRNSRRYWTHNSIAILDGYEQLSAWSRLLVSWTVRARGMRLLATAHTCIPGFAVLWTTFVNENSSKRIVEHLLGDHASQNTAPQLFQSEVWSTSRSRHGENLRETLFDMYDWWHRTELQATKTQ